MKLINQLEKRKSGNQWKRYALYECSECNIHFEARCETVEARNQEHCNKCASKYRAKKHGMSSSRLNSIYAGMIQRCTNKANSAYLKYGGRGLEVCQEWINSSSSFFEWALANGYDDLCSIDRIDNDLGYSPDNCRWTTRVVQSQNTRPIMVTNKSGYRGVSMHKASGKWVSQISVNSKKIHLGYFTTAEEASKAFIAYVKENNLEHKYE
jgi:DNA-directed RNA polymerase subunit RPC12/RpoP